MKYSSENLYLLDWENVILASQKADLFIFADADYSSIFSKETNADAVTYYKIKRILNDKWEFLRGLLREEYDEEGPEEVYSHLTRI